MTISYSRMRAVADRQIRKWGRQAKLRRASGDRDCWALEVQLSAHERNTLKNPTNRVFTISAVDLDVPPTREDALVWTQDGSEKVLRQDAPVTPLEPGGYVVYYEIQVSGS